MLINDIRTLVNERLTGEVFISPKLNNYYRISLSDDFDQLSPDDKRNVKTKALEYINEGKTRLENALDHNSSAKITPKTSYFSHIEIKLLDSISVDRAKNNLTNIKALITIVEGWTVAAKCILAVVGCFSLLKLSNQNSA